MADQFAGGILAGSTSVSIPIILRVKSDAAELTGKIASTVSPYYYRQGATATQLITAATLGSMGAAYSTGGWFEIDATNMQGLYRLDLPNTSVSTGAEWVVVAVKDTAGSSFYFFERFALETVHNHQMNTYVSGVPITIPNDHITSAKIAAGAIVYDDQLTTFKSELSGLVIAIPNDHITSAKIAAGALVYDDQITTFKSELSGLVVAIPDGHITAAKIGADAITSAKVGAGALDYGDQIIVFDASIKSAASAAWAAAAVTNNVVLSDAGLTATKIAADAITSAKIAAGAIVYDDQLTTFKSELSGLVISIPDDHITSAKIAAGAIVYDDQLTTFKSELSGLVISIPNDHITSAKIAAGAIVYDDQLTTFKSELSGLVITIPNDHITSAKVAAGALVYDDQITTFKSELSGLAITIPDGHITATKIGADAITSAKVAAGALDYGDQILVFDASIKSAASAAWAAAAATNNVVLSDAGLTATKIAADAITSAKVAAGAIVYDDQLTTFKSELSGMAITIPNDHITSAKVAAGALTYDDQITTFKSELSGLYTRLTTLGVRDVTQYTSAHVSAFPGSSPAFYDAVLWNYSQAGYKRLQQPTSYVLYDFAGTTKIASATVSGTSAEVIIGTFQ